MKKFLKYFLIVPIIFVALFTFYACGCSDNELKSVKLSIPSATLSNGFYTIDKAQIEDEFKRVKFDVEITPNSYTINSLEFFSSDTSIAQVSRRSQTIALIGIGQVKIYATYNNKEVASLNLLISDETKTLMFSEHTYITSYAGNPLQSNYKAIGDEEGNLDYSYYFIDREHNNALKKVSEIVNVGYYKIECVNPEDTTESAEAYVIVNKAKFTFTANNYESKYGSQFPGGLHYVGDVPDNVIGSSFATKFVYGLGKDANVQIGSMVEVTEASRTSNVGIYKTTYKMNLFSNYQDNYDIEYEVNEGSLTINPKKVVLKVKDQTSVYGDNAKNLFELYDYEEYTKNNNSIANLVPLDTSLIDYSKNITSINTVEYKLNNKPAPVNKAGMLDVILIDHGTFKEYGSYDISFSNVTTNNNLILERKDILNGALTIKPRGVTILPDSNQFKTFGSEDPLKFNYITLGSTVNNDEIINPLKVVYKVATERPLEDDENDYDTINPLGEGNYLANVGKYYFDIDNSLNKNYDFILDKRATEEGDVPLEQKIMFEVKPSQIVIKLKDSSFPFKKVKNSSGIAEGGQQLHSIGYYGSGEDYKVEIEKLTINGKNADLSTIEQGGEGKLGRISLNVEGNDKPMIGSFYFTIGVTKQEKSDYFITYQTLMSGIYYVEEANGNNYNITWESSVINLTKSVITIKIKDEANLTKIYDATNEDKNLFKNDYSNYFYAVDENNNEVLLDEIVKDANSLLTLKDINDEYTKLDSNGIYEKVTTFRNVGKYKIFLTATNNIILQEGKDHYDIVLDSSTVYFFEILPRQVMIIIDAGQGKVYGELDPELTYRFKTLPDNSDDLPNNDEVTITGSLKREQNENVGEYVITLGDKDNGGLSFGENYALMLEPLSSVKFQITPRKVTIKPYSNSYIYGDSVPDEIPFSIAIEDGYDNNMVTSGAIKLVTNADFKNNFYIVKQRKDVYNTTDNVQKDSAGFYPVNIIITKTEDENGEEIIEESIASYIIAQGEFVCLNNNYTIVFDDSSTITIDKREVILNIQPDDNVTDLNDVVIENINYTKYQVKNLAGNVQTSLTLLPKIVNGKYCDVQSFSLDILSGGESVASNYNITLGANIVYNIDLKIVYLSIVNADEYNKGNEVSSYQSVYTAKEFENIFTLICKDNNYIIDPSSKFRFIYKGGEKPSNAVKDVGSYVASLDLSREGDQLVLINQSLPEDNKDRVITFTKNDIDNNIEKGNVIINLSSFGYLTVTKAKIRIRSGVDVGFDSIFEYGDKFLPRLQVDNGGPVFIGVDDMGLTLKEFVVVDSLGNPVLDDNGNEVKLNFSSSNYTIENFQANRVYNIMLTVQAVNVNKREPDGSFAIDNNYEALFIQQGVPLDVRPREISVNSYEFVTRNGRETDFSNIMYDGTLKSLALNLTLNDPTMPYYTTAYSYQRLSVTYDYKKAQNGVAKAEVSTRSYDEFSGTVGDIETKVLWDDLPKPISSFQIKEINGTWYAILYSGYGAIALVMKDSSYSGVAPDDAGMYICVATCNAYENYTFTSLSGDGVTNSVRFASVFEIKKSNKIILNNKISSFYYSTKFDFNNQASLPFDYDITPAFLKKNVVISMSNYGDIGEGGTVNLNVGSHTATFTIITDNYYWTEDITFTIEKQKVDFVFPVLKTYVYLGVNVPVTSFLSNIRVVQKNNDGSTLDSFFYDPNSIRSKDIQLVFSGISSDGEVYPETKQAPYKIGTYKLKMVYGTTQIGGEQQGSSNTNWYGSGVFEYQIVQRTFTGSIRVENATITYDPLYQQQEFYELVLDKMFTIDRDSNEYTVEMYLGNSTDGEEIIPDKTIIYNKVEKPEDLGWLYKLNKTGQHYITFVIKFTDTTLNPVTKSALLTVKRQTLSLNDFNFTNLSAYTYDGYQKFNYIHFKTTNEEIADVQSNRAVVLDPARSNYTIVKDINRQTYIYHFRSIKTANDEYVTLLDNMFNPIFELRYKYQKGLGASAEQLPSAPISPYNNYVVYYEITGTDDYLANGIDRPFATFAINRMPTLFLSILNWDDSDLFYTGKNLLTREGSSALESVRKLGNKDLKDLILVRLEEAYQDSNVNFTLFYNSVYKEEFGVYLEIFFRDSEGNIVDEIIEAGNYSMHLGIAFTSNYEIINYFNNVCIGRANNDRREIATSALERSREDGIARNWYSEITTQYFTVHKAKYPYSAKDYNKAFGFRGTTGDEKVEGNTITIYTTGTFIRIAINTDEYENLTLEIKVREGAVFTPVTEIVGEQTYDFDTKKTYAVVIKHKNYEPSEDIIIVFSPPLN